MRHAEGASAVQSLPLMLLLLPRGWGAAPLACSMPTLRVYAQRNARKDIPKKLKLNLSK
ncbi:MAG: hypothetical protein NZ455_02895 [Bacteroidia bacterium]|nr:hypothetical protein [Bacteroidia bacterium]MDW8347614.1 hypothetical protein [Bacteroidia bacterium]